MGTALEPTGRQSLQGQLAATFSGMSAKAKDPSGLGAGGSGQAMIRRWMARWREMSWLQFLLLLFAVYFFCKLAVLLLPHAPPRRILDGSRHYLLLALLLGKLVLEVPMALRRYCAVEREGGSARARLGAIVPDELRACVRLDRAMWRGFVGWLRRRPPAWEVPAGVRFGFLKFGMYGSVVVMALVAVFTEVPLALLMATASGQSETQRYLTDFILAGLVVYSLMWLLGDRWLVKHSFHVLASDHLELRVGERAWATVPLDAIAGVQAVSLSRAEWCSVHGVDQVATVPITPIDKPNLVVALKPGWAIFVQYLQLVRPRCTHLFVYVDRPAEFLSLLQAKLRELSVEAGQDREALSGGADGSGHVAGR